MLYAKSKGFVLVGILTLLLLEPAVFADEAKASTPPIYELIHKRAAGIGPRDVTEESSLSNWELMGRPAGWKPTGPRDVVRASSLSKYRLMYKSILATSPTDLTKPSSLSNLELLNKKPRGIGPKDEASKSSISNFKLMNVSADLKFRRSDMETFVDSFNFPNLQTIRVLLDIPERSEKISETSHLGLREEKHIVEMPEQDVKVFDVFYGTPSDCPAGCIYSRAVGIKNGDKIGWILIHDYGNANVSNIKIYDFDSKDKYLFTEQFAVKLQSLGVRYPQAFVPLIARDPDTPEDTLLKIAQGNYLDAHSVPVASLLKNPKVRSNKQILAAIINFPFTWVDYSEGDMYRELRVEAWSLLENLTSPPPPSYLPSGFPAYVPDGTYSVTARLCRSQEGCYGETFLVTKIVITDSNKPGKSEKLASVLKQFIEGGTQCTYAGILCKLTYSPFNGSSFVASYTLVNCVLGPCTTTTIDFKLSREGPPQ